MAGREFTTAVQKAEETPESTYEFTVDGHDCVAFKPSEAQFAVVMSQVGRYSKMQDQIAGVINFFAGVLDDQSQEYIVNRLLDRKDPFGLTEVQDIMEWLVEEWSGRPTKSPSVSTR